MTPFDLSHMAINAPRNRFEFITIMNDADHDDDDALDLELYSCKFYDKNIHVKHTHFLIVPTDKDNTTIHVHYDLDVQPNNEAVKRWTQQPWYHHSIIEKYHLLQPKHSLPVSNKNPSKRLWTKWQKKGEKVHYPSFMYSQTVEEE